ncbi:MAG: hypothetical protein IJ722_02495 [Alloprevotella sp.]|nr:hypothetical protein [Alloprevotella sp.]
MQQQSNEQRPAAHEAQDGKKAYAPPRMQVIPLNCQLLAASQATGPVHVTIAGGMSYYWGAECLGIINTAVPCDAFRTSLKDTYGEYEWTDGADTEGISAGFYPASCFGANSIHWRTQAFDYIEPSVVFGAGGETWDATDFLANVVLPNGCAVKGEWPTNRGSWGHLDATGIVGSYRGTPVVVTFQFFGSCHNCG